MSARPARSTVDPDPRTSARPRLALGLALVSVPGVTIAWDVVTTTSGADDTLTVVG